MKNCKTIMGQEECKYIGIYADGNNNQECYVVSKCNTGKVMGFSERDVRNYPVVIKDFLDKVYDVSNKKNIKPLEVLRKLANQFDISAIRIANLNNVAIQVGSKFNINSDICICVIRINKNNFFIEKVGKNKSHKFLTNNQCNFMSLDTLSKMTNKLN